MKILSRVSDADAKRINEQFSNLQVILEDGIAAGMQKVAISVFDHWLRDESEWHLMDCFDGPERHRRDQMFEAHWAAIFDLTPAYTLRWRGRWPKKAKLILKHYTSREGFLRQTRFDKLKAPTQFLILPELGCIYRAGWDDTNILYYHERTKVDEILKLAFQCDLFVLSYDD